ncbi:MAG TPA: hypothetical protein DIU37_01500 [Opitutae bacterium]|nr:hypothetical protein [Opitutae bacterium]|tara:strand:+ start:670 stop:1044 length:375 start_codon:yes stop_codon:yes gene_type:complete
MDIKKELKYIERVEARLAKKKEDLIEQEKRLQEADSKLDFLFRESGYATPKEFVEALILKFKIKLTPSGRLVKRRKRTKITAELRDSIAKNLANGMSMNAASKYYNVSYAVVVKVKKGQYNHVR